MRSRRARVLSVAALLLVAGGVAAYLWLGYRPQTVLEGRIYRSRQPGADDLRRAAGELGLRSVVNLRGAQPGREWFDEEVAATAELSLDRLDLRFRSFDWPPRPEVRRLVHYLDAAAPPMLLHCQNGIHRSGWASALVLALDGRPLSEVRDQLATLPRSLSDTRPDYGGRFFDLYEAWLDRVSREHSADAFRHWVLDVYCPPPYDAKITVEQAPALDVVPTGAPLSLVVEVTNRSAESWVLSSDPQRGIRVGASLLGPFDDRPSEPLKLFRRPGMQGKDLARAGMEDGAIDPGASRRFRLEFRAPDRPGLYLLHIDMVDEGVHWFSDLGTPGVILDLGVVDRAD